VFMSIRPYPIRIEDLRNVLTLSHLSLVEIARRFGVSRSNLMGVVGGSRTLSDDRLLQLVNWAGLVAEVDTSNTLHLGSGIHLWKIASETQMEAFLHLPPGMLPEHLRWSVVLEFPPQERDWIHLMAEVGKDCWVLLSVRPVFFALLRDRVPGFGRPVELMYLQKPLKQIITHTGDKGLPVAWAKQPQTLTSVDAPMRDAHAADLSAWMAWARQKLALDTSEISDQTHPPVTVPIDGQVQTVACDQAWALLAHRLDVAGAADVADIPVFPMGKLSDYPTGMVRMDRIWLGDNLLELGEKGRLRCYVKGDGTESVIVALFAAARCGLPQPWVAPPKAESYLIWRDQTLETSAQIGADDHCIGPVVASWSRGKNFPDNRMDS
jgi:transcriptional regulator with XRE-family HTH domain